MLLLLLKLVTRILSYIAESVGKTQLVVAFFLTCEAFGRRAYQLVKDLTTVKQGKVTTVQDRSGKCLTEERQILNRWAEYCSELYNHKANGDSSVCVACTWYYFAKCTLPVLVYNLSSRTCA